MKFQSLLINKSIRFRIISIFVSIIVMMAIGSWVSLSQQNMITNQYYRFMNNNISLSKLPIKVDQYAQAFERYLKEKDTNSLEEYYQINNHISEVLKSLNDDFVNNANTLIYYRSFSAMQEYQFEIVNKILQNNRFDEKAYSDLTYLRALYTYMNRQSQLLAISYLDYGNTKHSQLLENYKNTEKYINIIIIALACISIIFAIFFSNDIFATIHTLYYAARLLSDGYWEIPDIEENKYTELNSVAKAFNNMKKNIRMYIQELNQKAEVEIQLNKEKLRNAEKDKLLKESQLLALQMQINPHFLFNTLNMIGRTAMLEETDSTVRLIESISKILRYNLENTGRTVSLEDEISTLKAYIYVQKMRFQERMSIKIDTACDIQGINITPMVLQPIVENSIMHGLRDKCKDGKVDIAVCKEKEYVKILVSDNGKGIEEKILTSIFEEKKYQERINQNTSIGLSNVKKRLELYFEQDNLIHIQSQLGIGTTVIIKIPLKGVSQCND